jgi:outer membrane protein
MLRQLVSFTTLFLVLATPAYAISLSEALQHLPQAPGWVSADLAYEAVLRQLEAAQAGLGLKASLGGDYSLAGSSTTSPDPTQRLSLSGSASLGGLLPWSSAYDSLRSAERNLARSALERQEARNTLYANVVGQYFSARQAALNDQVAQAALQLRQRQLQVTTARQQVGQATLEDLITAQQNLADAQVSVINAEGNLSLARLTLANTLGLEVGALGELSTPPEAAELPQESLEQLLARALSRRPDVQKAQLQVAEAEDKLTIAQRDRWFPAASLSVGFGSSQQGGGSVQAGFNLQSGLATLSASYPLMGSSGTGSSAITLGLSVDLAVLAPGSDAAIVSAQNALTSAHKALESVRKSAELDVRQKYLEAQNARARVEVARLALSNAEQSLRTAQARLSAGTATTLDVQLAQLNLQQSRLDLETALASAHTATLRLQTALGEDLSGGNR